MNEETEYGGKRSNRYKEGEMLFIWGHDEAIFKQFLLMKKKKLGGPQWRDFNRPKRQWNWADDLCISEQQIRIWSRTE
jgi:hypothetical protein